MGTWTREVRVEDCGQDHGGRCPGHTVSVSLHRSTDMTSLSTDAGTVVMPDRLADALFALWREMREEAV